VACKPPKQTAGGLFSFVSLMAGGDQSSSPRRREEPKSRNECKTYPTFLAFFAVDCKTVFVIDYFTSRSVVGKGFLRFLHVTSDVAMTWRYLCARFIRFDYVLRLPQEQSTVQ